MRPFDAPETERIVAFLGTNGIVVERRDLPHATFLPDLDVVRGQLRVNPQRLAWPGDLLHEAGHIAVSDPANRGTAAAVSTDPAEEMAAIA